MADKEDSLNILLLDEIKDFDDYPNLCEECLENGLEKVEILPSEHDWK